MPATKTPGHPLKNVGLQFPDQFTKLTLHVPKTFYQCCGGKNILLILTCFYHKNVAGFFVGIFAEEIKSSQNL
jgi:hypothetical protein